jgi:hypothetical protein
MRNTPSGVIIKANARYRRLVAAILLVIVLLCSLLAVGFRSHSERRLKAFEQEIRQKSHPEFVDELKCVSRVISLAAAVPLMVVGVTLLYQARRVLAAQRYPYPGMMILRDTKLQEGTAAIQRGRITAFVGSALLVLAGVIGSLMYLMLVRVIPLK